MDDPGALATLILTALAIMGSPGPSTVSVTAVAGSFGVRRTLPYFAGLVAGTTLVLIAVASGLTAALLAVPGIAPVLIAASIGYVLYLAWQIATAPPLAAIHPAARPPSPWGGFILGAANPKAYVAIAAVFAANRLSADAAVDAVGQTLVLSAMIVLIHVAWLVAGAMIAGTLRDPFKGRVVNVGMAAALVGFSLLALWPKRPR